MDHFTLSNVFNECLERLAAGETVEQCLRRYPPEQAETLRPLLQTVRLAQSALPGEAEVRVAQRRARRRFEEALAEQSRRRPVLAWRLPRWLAAAAILVLAFAGVVFAASNSLPGDPLYGLKRQGENVGLALAGDSETALEQLRQKRLEEVRLLLALGREETVTFSGTLESIQDGVWQVDGLQLLIETGTQINGAIRPGDEIEVTAQTTVDRQLIARAVRLLEAAAPEATPETTEPMPSRTPTPTATLTEVSEPTATNTPAPTSTERPTVTDTAAPTSTERPTATATVTPNVPPTATISPVQSSVEGCVPAHPDGWIVYRIRAGDTLSGFAQATGATIEEIIATNCLRSDGLIVVGQYIYLPSVPPTRAPAVQSQPPAVPPSDSSGPGPSGGDDSSGNRGPGGGDDDHDDSSGS